MAHLENLYVIHDLLSIMKPRNELLHGAIKYYNELQIQQLLLILQD